MHIDKIITTTLGLLCSLGASAHGPHAEIQGTAGIAETLMHLAAHAWPIIPPALIFIWLYRKRQSTG